VAGRRAEGVVSDLRDITLRSAPALLLVVLGEFVLPHDEPVWSATLMRALADLDVEPTAARKAIQRTTERGVVAAEKDGRRVRITLTDAGRRLLNAGGERVFGFTGESRDWDGRWLALTLTVPETHRHLRHHLRTRLTWAGLGSPTAGLWVTPHTARADEVAHIVDDLGLSDLAFSHVGAFGPVGDERRMVEQAWDLDDLAGHYADFLHRFRRLRADDARAAFRQRVELVQAWRRFPYLDPALPARLSRPTWIGVEAAGFLHHTRSAWAPGSDEHWARLGQPVT